MKALLAILKIPVLRLINGVALVGLTGGASYMGYQYLEARESADIYRDRLTELNESYEDLRRLYNTAVERQAVTELLVRDDTITVLVRNPGGVVEEIATPYDPRGEVYVDYVVADGRLLIRRVFDELTPPASGTVIDPAVEFVDWADPRMLQGQAVYRQLDEGRWIITVTGNGSLGLVRAGDAGDVGELVSEPEIADFSSLPEEADAEVERIRVGELLQRLVSDPDEDEGS
ncbi:MAG: hypothetical protein AAGB51_05035 [Planctomycetota bacterium]